MFKFQSPLLCITIYQIISTTTILNHASNLAISHKKNNTNLLRLDPMTHDSHIAISDLMVCKGTPGQDGSNTLFRCELHDEAHFPPLAHTVHRLDLAETRGEELAKQGLILDVDWHVANEDRLRVEFRRGLMCCIQVFV